MKTLGSEAKVRFVKSILDVEPEALKSVAGVVRIGAHCSEDYRKDHPARSIADFDAFNLSADGKAWRRQCQMRILTPPEAETLRQAFLAMLELRMVVTNLITPRANDEGAGARGDRLPTDARSRQEARPRAGRRSDANAGSLHLRLRALESRLRSVPRPNFAGAERCPVGRRGSLPDACILKSSFIQRS